MGDEYFKKRFLNSTSSEDKPAIDVYNDTTKLDLFNPILSLKMVVVTHYFLNQMNI